MKIAPAKIRLTEILNEKGLTIDQAAKATQVSKQALYELRSSDAKGIRFETIAKLCKGLNVQPCDLIEVEGKK